MGGNLGGSSEPGDKLKSKRKIFKPPPTSFSAGADLIKVQKRFLTNKLKFTFHLNAMVYNLQCTGCIKVKQTLRLVDISSAGLANH